DSAASLCECGDSAGDSATMVMPSFSISAPCKPHIGSDLGGGTFFAAIPDSQCPALPTQQGIVSALPSAALAMRNGSAATKRHKKNRTPIENILCLMCFFVAIRVKLLSRFLRDGLLNQFHFALRTGATFLRGDVFVHGADIVEFDWLARMSRAFLLCCGNDSHRVHRGTAMKQCGREQHGRK